MIGIRTLLHSQIAGWEKARDHKMLHASDITQEDWCPRAWALMDATSKNFPDQFIPTSLRVTFDYGNHLEDSIQNNYLRDYIRGKWICQSCGTQKLGGYPEEKCGREGITCRFKYGQIRIRSPISDVSCELDGLLDDEGMLRLIEIKTMVKDDFKNLQAPLQEHRIRTCVYLRCLAEANSGKRIHLDAAILLYVCKGYGVKDELLKAAMVDQGISDWAFTPYKSYTIKRYDESVEHLWAKAMPLKRFRGGGPMPCGVCVNAMSKKAKDCPVVKECFSGTFPGMTTWLKEGQPHHPGKEVIK